MGLRERKRADTRRAIQEHALRLCLAAGFETTTVAEIAAAAGVSQMTVFRHHSEVSRLNATAAGGFVKVEPRLFELFARCAVWARETGGAPARSSTKLGR